MALDLLPFPAFGGSVNPLLQPPYRLLLRGPVATGPQGWGRRIGPFSEQVSPSNFPNAAGATEFLYRQDQSDVGTLSGWVSLPYGSPIRPITGRPSLPPTSHSPCPSPFLTVGIPPRREAWGFPSWRQRRCGRGRLEPLTRWE